MTCNTYLQLKSLNKYLYVEYFDIFPYDFKDDTLAPASQQSTTTKNHLIVIDMLVDVLDFQ